MNDCINITATATNPHFKSPYEMYFGKLPPASTLAFMQPGFRRIHRTQKSEPKAERCFYPNSGHAMEGEIAGLEEAGTFGDA